MSYSYSRGDSKETCGNCGAVYRLEVPGQKGFEESEEYYCPECRAEYRVRASMSPKVTLISKRTDGK
jgi:rubredoxin